MDKLSVVSLEGNWDAAINSSRLHRAAALFHQSHADFIISSGTYEPGAHTAARGKVQKLGERNARALRDLHSIDTALIIPAYAFPFAFTYTTIEAFGNACVIGWLVSGFKPLPRPVRINFAPVSSGGHCRRVYVLNHRACKALTQFNVETIVQEQPLEPDDPIIAESEARKLNEVMREGGVIATGRWLHGEVAWSLDDPSLMQSTMAQLIRTVVPGLCNEQVEQILGAASLAQRYVVMQMLCEISVYRTIGSSALERILARTARAFPSTFEEANALRFAKEMARALR